MIPDNFDYFENSCNHHEFLKMRNFFFMTILLTFQATIPFLKINSKKMKFQILNFSKIETFYPNLTFFSVKIVKYTFSY